MSPITPRRYWASTLAAAVTVSVAGNVGHALLTAPEALRIPAALAAALPPLVLLVVTEGLVRSAGHSARRWTYRAGVTGAVAIAGLAFVLSFAALRDLAIALGQPRAVAAGWPLLADAAIAVSSVMLLATKSQTTAPATPAAPLAEVVYPDQLAWMTEDFEVVATPDSPAEPDHFTEPLDLPQATLAAPATSADTADEPADEPVDPLLGQARGIVARGVTTVPVAAVHEILRLDCEGLSARSIAGTGVASRTTVAKVLAAAATTAEPAEATVAA